MWSRLFVDPVTWQPVVLAIVPTLVLAWLAALVRTPPGAARAARVAPRDVERVEPARARPAAAARGRRVPAGCRTRCWCRRSSSPACVRAPACTSRTLGAWTFGAGLRVVAIAAARLRLGARHQPGGAALRARGRRAAAASMRSSGPSARARSAPPVSKVVDGADRRDCRADDPAASSTSTSRRC